jgi:DNA mismatch endonuclease (patch repair protein)
MRAPKSKNRVVSKVMRANKSEGTSLELKIRKEVSSAGIKGYRLNFSKVPSRPDIAFVNRKIAIIVNGCFWHGCRICIKKMPQTNSKYWAWKMETNRARDKRNAAKLKRLGWRVYRVWEHDVKKGDLKPLMVWLKGSLKKRA